MGEKRGQAFETMMLVISVIVAIAILGILLSFLSGITIIGADAEQKLPQNVKSIYSAGYGVKVEQSIDFRMGSTITAKDLTSNSFPESDLYVECADDASAICGTGEDTAITIIENPGSIFVNKAIKASVAVCQYPGKDAAYLVVIGIRDKVAAVRSKCMG